MKFKVTTKDPIEAKRLAKADDMAFVLFDIVHNLPKSMRDTNPENEDFHMGVEAVMERIRDLMDIHSININDILE